MVEPQRSGEVSIPAIFGALNSARYVYLRQLTEPRDNSLLLLVEEAVLNESPPLNRPETPESSQIVTRYSPIESVKGCKKFELFWKHYAAYLVTEELVGSCGKNDDEAFTGNVFRIYTKSHFLDHLSRDTGGHPEDLQHYKLICLNHKIDVASYAPPEIRLMEPTAAPPH